jgi:sialic acid synthase SpsE
MQMKEIIIGNRVISENSRPYFIADIAANHDGNLDRAFKLIELAKSAGADAAKFQNFTANKIVSKKGFDNIGKITHQSSWSKSVFEVYEDAAIDKTWTKLLKEKCDNVGIEYMSTPYDFESLELILPFSNAIKIGSGDITWHSFLSKVSKTKLPVILSTGASTIEEVELAYEIIASENNQLILMQCNTNYTGDIANFDHINLKVLSSYKKKFPNVILGLSDHTPGHTTVLGAIALGARVIEKHFTDDTNRIGPDHSFSMDPNTWREMVDRSIELWKSMGDGVKKVELNETESRMVQRRGVYLRRDYYKGERILLEDLEFLRPISINGIPPFKVEDVIGKRMRIDKQIYTQLEWDDFE